MDTIRTTALPKKAGMKVLRRLSTITSITTPRISSGMLLNASPEAPMTDQT